ncbi:MAG: phytanoyl-CoA dioxygenase family protein [Gemmatimonadetes bacterium]|nr:phytanoyl-CoA dioxygenase family protein [Gemmatimonadota bacterium]
MDMAILSEDQRRSFERDGYLHVPGVLSHAEVERYPETCDPLIAAFRDGRFRQKPDPGGAYFQLRDSVIQEPELRRLLAHSPAVPFLVQLLSPNIHLHTAAVVYKNPESEDHGRRTWHRDIGLTRDLGHAGQVRAGVKVCYCLTDFPAHRCGITMFARGSHRLQEPLGIPEGDVDPPSMIELTPRAGDAVLFENRTFHSVAPNTGDRVSKAVIYGYSYRWMRADYHLRLPDPELAGAAGPVEKQLLGGSPGEPLPDTLKEWARENGLPVEEVPMTVEVPAG